MSIGSVQSNPWSNPWDQSVSSQSGTSAASSSGVQGSFGPPMPNGPWSGQDSGGTTATAPANPFQTLASDIQAMLIQAQDTGAATAAAGTSASATASAGGTALTPEQQVAADLQNMMTELQSSASSSTQTANANPADPTSQTGQTGQTEHHHHHHHGGGGEASGATAVADASTTATTTAATAGDQSESQALSVDFTAAIQAYSGANASSLMPMLTI
jgi:hypothetical protein